MRSVPEAVAAGFDLDPVGAYPVATALGTDLIRQSLIRRGEALLMTRVLYVQPRSKKIRNRMPAGTRSEDTKNRPLPF